MASGRPRQPHDQGAGDQGRACRRSASSSARASTSTSRCCSRSRSMKRSSKPIWRVSNIWSRSGGDPQQVASVASFFVSRIDVAVDKLIEEGSRRPNEPASARRWPACAARSRSPTPSSPISATSVSSAGAALGEAAGQGRARAAPALGEHRHQEQGLQRRSLCRGADRSRHGQHDAAGDDGRVPRSRQSARRPSKRISTRPSRRWRRLRSPASRSTR